MKHEGKHRWAMSWPGNYCVCCGHDDGIEDAICCRDCEFFYPNSGIDEVLTPDVIPPPPVLCPKHQAWVDVKCSCTKEHEK